MAVKSAPNRRETGKVALLAGIIVVALSALAVSVYRFQFASPPASGEVKQMKAGARGRKHVSGSSYRLPAKLPKRRSSPGVQAFRSADIRADRA
jgi:hypothetical protein